MDPRVEERERRVLDYGEIEKKVVAEFIKRQRREARRKAMVTITIFIGILFLLNYIQPTDDTDKDRWNRSGMSLFTDNKTGLQYIKGGLFGTMIPRLDENGDHMKAEKK